MGKTKFGARKPASAPKRAEQPKKVTPKRLPNKKPSANDMIRDGSDMGQFI